MLHPVLRAFGTRSRETSIYPICRTTSRLGPNESRDHTIVAISWKVSYTSRSYWRLYLHVHTVTSMLGLGEFNFKTGYPLSRYIANLYGPDSEIELGP